MSALCIVGGFRDRARTSERAQLRLGALRLGDAVEHRHLRNVDADAALRQTVRRQLAAERDKAAVSQIFGRFVPEAVATSMIDASGALDPIAAVPSKLVPMKLL